MLTTGENIKYFHYLPINLLIMIKNKIFQLIKCVQYIFNVMKY